MGIELGFLNVYLGLNDAVSKCRLYGGKC